MVPLTVRTVADMPWEVFPHAPYTPNLATTDLHFIIIIRQECRTTERYPAMVTITTAFLLYQRHQRPSTMQ